MAEDQHFAEDAPEAIAMAAELERELARVGVDWDEASAPLVELAPTTETVISDEEVEVCVMLDVSGMLATLQALPDGAGTAAFVAAFRQRQVGSEPPPT